MIARYLVRRVRDYLKEGKLGHRKIARRTGVSRGSVSSIAAMKGRFQYPNPGKTDEFFDPDIHFEDYDEWFEQKDMPEPRDDHFDQAAAPHDCNDQFKKNDADDDLYKPDVPPERCPECGEMVYPPCLLCETRSLLAKHPGHVIRRCRPDSPILVGLDLEPEHQKRYEKIRKKRRKKTPPGTPIL
jgi:hypothetical protein